ncbi:23089_t:CDS:2, partial [Dentiscutata erythropus]
FFNIENIETSIDLNLNIEIEYSNSDELSDEKYNEPLELYEEQLFKTTKKAYAKVKTFTNLYGFRIQKRCVEKDANTGYEISRMFLY